MSNPSQTGGTGPESVQNMSQELQGEREAEQNGFADDVVTQVEEREDELTRDLMSDASPKEAAGTTTDAPGAGSSPGGADAAASA